MIKVSNIRQAAVFSLGIIQLLCHTFLAISGPPPPLILIVKPLANPQSPINFNTVIYEDPTPSPPKNEIKMNK